ncbi:MAG: imidazole glycerol phosphate synthase subunit HisH, partial [Chloroflexota bacterium]
MAKITMIDYGASNIRSALKAFEYLGADIELTDDPKKVRQAGRMVLPGVGAFGSGMDAVRALGLDEAVQERVTAGV